MEKENTLCQALQAYDFPPTCLGAVPYGHGHINETYCVVCQGRTGEPVRFVLQKISAVAFPEPEKLMANFASVTGYLRRQILAQGGDPNREALSLIPTRKGEPFFRDSQGGIWRMMPMIEGADCYQQATPELFRESGRTFGYFQYLLRDFPAETLFETIPDFHNTPDRFRKFQAALQADPLGRAGEIRREADFVLAREADCAVALNARNRGELPVRVTHNDTKLNNILVDRATHRGLCVLDLDTTMPGLSLYDYGDSIRFGANHCAEDERDLSKAALDLELCRVFTRGFLQGAGGSLTPAERAYLPWGARLMTLECGIRFLTDYLMGDVYFHTSRPGQNLDRARVQFQLTADMERRFDDLKRIAEEAK